MMGIRVDLLPFDESAACPKCGGTDVRVDWRPDSRDYGCSIARDHPIPIGGAEYDRWCSRFDVEHFERSCQRCRYKWAEGVPITSGDHK